MRTLVVILVNKLVFHQTGNLNKTWLFTCCNTHLKFIIRPSMPVVQKDVLADVTSAVTGGMTATATGASGSGLPTSMASASELGSNFMSYFFFLFYINYFFFMH